MTKPSIFISAVSSEFGSIRRLVAESLMRLGYEPITQEIFGTEPGDLTEVLRRKIDQCEGVVHIAGVAYGAEPPAANAQFGRCSYTQFEFLYAQEKKLKTWVIIPGDGCTPDKPVDQLDLPHDPAIPNPLAWQAERRELQRRYRETVQASSHLWHRPDSRDGLLLAVERMRDELDLLRKQTEERYHDQKSQLDRIEKLLASQLQANPQTEPKLSDADQALLDQARRHGDLKSRAAAAVLQPDADTDALLKQLQSQHDAQAFDLAMLNGKRWYFARPIAQFDKAVPFFESAMHLRPDSFGARSYAASSHSSGRLGDIAAHQKRAIEIGEGTLNLVPSNSPDWAATQNNLAIAWGNLPTGDRAKNLQTAIDCYTRALEIRTKADFPADWAGTQNNLAIAWRNLPTGNRAKNLQTAIECYTRALEVCTKADFPAKWAMTQNNLAIAWRNLPTGDRAKNLQTAIECFTRALEVRTKADFPADWAMTQNNLAVAWSDLPTGDRAKNLQTAIDCYTRALEVNTKADFPADWARTQNNLGNAWSNLPTGDRAKNLQTAIDCYTRALEVYTKAGFPADWAMTQNNLAIAWLSLPTGDRAKNLQTAIDCYTRALEVYTKADFPADWAMTQNNLAIAWRNLPTGDRAKNLQTAIDCYTRALEIYTKADFPADWAMTQNNLAVAWSNLPTGDRAKSLQTAIDCYTRALEVRTKADFPADWAMTQNNLGNAWLSLPTGDRAENLQTAIDCYTRALEVRTKADFPADWPMTQYNLAIAWADMADQPNLPTGQDRCGLLRRAIACNKGALTIRTPDAFPHDHADTMKNMDIDRRAYDAAGCAEKIPFDDIPPAE